MGLSHDLPALLVGDMAILAIGAAAWRRNHDSRASKLFFTAMLAFVFWLTTNYFSLQSFDIGVVSLYTRVNYVAGLWLMIACWLFCSAFPVDRQSSSTVKAVVSALLVLGTPFSYSPLVVRSVAYEQGKLVINSAPLYFVYGLLIAGLAIAAVFGLRQNYRQASLLQRNQIRYVAFGVIFSALISITFNVVLVPILGPQWGSPLINLLVTLPVVVFIGYGLIRNRYTDVQRIMSYLATYAACAALIIVWLLAVHWLAVKAYPGSILNQAVAVLLAATVAVFGLQPVKRSIMLRSDKFFNVGWYDSQNLLNSFGSLLAGELHLVPLLKNSVQRLCDELQVTSAQLVLVADGKQGRAVGYGSWQHADIATAPFKVVKRILLADELKASHQLLPYMEQKGIRGVVPLETRGKRVGYLFLGIKRHGDVFSPQDIGVLQILSSQLAVAIVSAQAFEQISNFNATLQNQVTGATADLRKVNDKLQMSDRLKTEFIILTSHNLRTPLSIVKGYISLLEDTELDAAQKQLLASMKTGSDRLSQFTEDLLAIDSLVAGNQLELQPTPIMDILQPLFKEAADSAGAKGLHFSAKLDDRSKKLVINANQLRLSGAIRNLLDNAFKFTDKGSVELSVKTAAGKLVITVTDTGIGIAAHEIPQLFTQFHRATDTLVYEYEGEGIGLYLTSLVIKEHGGDITVTSTPGQGSMFTVTLPAQPSPPKR